MLSGNFDRFRFPPYGLNGGKPGTPGRFILTRDGKSELLPSKISGVQLKRGDKVRLDTSGGGGWGDPSRRDPKLKLADQRAGYTSSS